ncbi:MAG: hypothetical protein J6V42_01035 [Clostridia bacterium]|nr:hypothetical protein [Clostridia bacterium]
MKNIAKRALLLALAALMLFSLVSCAKKKIVIDGSELKDKRTKVKYTYASLSYEPIARSEDVYGSTDKHNFYEIVGQDPLNLICEEDGTVFVSNKFTLPTPDQMSFAYLEICTETTALTVNKTLTDTALIKAIMTEHLYAPTINYMGLEASLTHKLRFADTSLGLFYTVQFLRYENDVIQLDENGVEVNYGKDFIYDRFEGRFTKAPAALVAAIDG